MLETVNAGVLDTINKLLNTIDNAFNKISKWAGAVQDKEKRSDGSVVLTVLPQGYCPYKLRYLLRTLSDEELQQVRSTYSLGDDASITAYYVSGMTVDGAVYENFVTSYESDGKKLNEDEVNEKLEDFVTKVVHKFPDADGDGQADSEDGAQQQAAASRKFSVKLAKVVSSESTDVKLLAVTANYNASAVLADINAMVSDASFLSEMPDSASYSVTVADDCLEVADCDECETSPSTAIKAIASVLYKLNMDARSFKWNIKDINAGEVRSRCDQLEWTSQAEIDELCILHKEMIGTAPHPFELIQRLDMSAGAGETISAADAYARLYSDVVEVFSAYELYGSMMPKDVVVDWNQRERGWKRTARYTLSGYMCEEPAETAALVPAIIAEGV